MYINHKHLNCKKYFLCSACTSNVKKSILGCNRLCWSLQQCFHQQTLTLYDNNSSRAAPPSLLQRSHCCPDVSGSQPHQHVNMQPVDLLQKTALMVTRNKHSQWNIVELCLDRTELPGARQADRVFTWLFMKNIYTVAQKLPEMYPFFVSFYLFCLLIIFVLLFTLYILDQWF